MPARLVRLTLTAGAIVLLAALPAGAQYSLYYGNLHSHCNISDDATGPLSGPPDEAFAYARDVANIDVLALTDHSHWMTASEYSWLQQEADNFTQNGVFVALAGQEHGSLSTSREGAFGHCNIYEASVVIPQYIGGTDFRYNLPGTYLWIANNVDDTIGEQLVGAVNHPYEGSGCGIWAQFANLAWDSTGDEAMELFEILNGMRSASYESEFFEALANGWHVGVLADQDNHEGMWGNQPNNNGNIPLNGIWAPDLTKEDILRALAARRTFAMEVQPESDRWSLRFTADGNWMGSEYSTSADSVTIVVDIAAETNIASINLYRNSVLIKSTGVGAPAYTWTVYDAPGPGDFYYFVRASQSDGDRAWSSPIWIHSSSSFTTPIAEVIENDASGLPIRLYETVTVQGIVTVDTDTLSTSDNLVYIQDVTGGVQVWEIGAQTTPLALGHNVMVSGLVDNYLGQTFLSPTSITILGLGGVPQATAVSTNDLATVGETWEGSLIVIYDASITAGTWPSPGTSGTVTIDDGSGPCDLFIDGDTSLDDLGAPATQPFSVRGLVGQADPTMPYFDGYRIIPRFADDIFDSTGVDVPERIHAEGGSETRLLPNSPNPFRPSTTIAFELAGPGRQAVRLAVFDVTGRRVKTLVDEPLSPGRHEVSWNGCGVDGRRVAAGVYFYRLAAGSTDVTRKMVILR